MKLVTRVRENVENTRSKRDVRGATGKSRSFLMLFPKGNKGTVCCQA